MLLTTILCCGAAGLQKVVTPTEAGDSYTITTTVKLARPYDIAAMNDEFQTAKLIKDEGDAATFQIIYKPFHVQTVTADPEWRQHDAGMSEYIKPRLAANWTPELQKQIVADLKADGIDPDALDDKTLVEKLSSWALHRSKFNTQFGLWMVEFVDGKPEVRPELRAKFDNEEPKGDTDQNIFDRELFGAGMYQTKSHGSCTSTATYMATILRAVGIPTRIILTVPACDPNDPTQVKMLTQAIRHNETRHAVQLGVSGHGFTNHVFTEVWVGGKWVRLNYNRLAQPILDPSYLGLMTHVYTCLDFSEVPYATTWGARYALGAGPKLSSENPYQLLSARDDLAPGLVLDNPPVQTLTAVTIIAVI